MNYEDDRRLQELAVYLCKKFNKPERIEEDIADLDEDADENGYRRPSEAQKRRIRHFALHLMEIQGPDIYVSGDEEISMTWATKDKSLHVLFTMTQERFNAFVVLFGQRFQLTKTDDQRVSRMLKRKWRKMKERNEWLRMKKLNNE